MINFFGNNVLINNEAIKEILNDIITPLLEDYGFKYNGDYLWYTDSINSIRKIIKYQRLKGETGILEWGVCLDFVPTISGSSLKWNRTEKTMTLHLFEWPKDYADSFFDGGMAYLYASHWGKNEFKKSLKKFLDKHWNDLFDWFTKAGNIEGLIKIAEYQVTSFKGYSTHYPNPKYVLAFLYAKTNRLDDSIHLFEGLNIDLKIRDKILKLIKK